MERRERPLILVVDDDPDICMLISLWLEFEGCATSQAVDGADALSKASALRPDAILMDIKMPVMGGYQVLQHLKAHPDLALIPVAFQSSNGSGEHIAEALALGADRYMTKPFDPDELVAVVRELVTIADERRQT